MQTSTRFTRRTLLQSAGAATLATTGAGRARAASSRAPVSLEFWNPATDTHGRTVIADAVATFNKTIGQAAGIVVHDRPTPGDNGYVKYTTAMSSSGSPDVVMTYDYYPLSSWAANGFIQPIDGLAKQAGIKQSDFFPLTRRMISFSGHIWGLLQEFDFNEFAWNKALYNGPPPTTIAALDALAARFTKFDAKGNLIQAAIIPWSQPLFTRYADWSALWGASFYNHTTGKWTINTPQNRAFLEWYLKYVHLLGGRTKADTLVSSLGSGFQGDPFLAGKTAFGMVGEWYPLPQHGWFPVYAPAMKYGLARPPTAPGVPYGTAVAEGGNSFVLPTKSGHPQQAAIFMAYMGGTPGVQAWNFATGNIPPLKSVADDPAFARKLPYIKLWISTLALNHMVPPIPSPQFPLFDAQMANAVDEVTYLRMTPAQALASVEQKVSTAVQQFQQAHPTWPGE